MLKKVTLRRILKLGRDFFLFLIARKGSDKVI